MKLIFACICLYLTVFSLASTQQYVLMRSMGSGLNRLPQPQPQPQPEPEQELEAWQAHWRPGRPGAAAAAAGAGAGARTGGLAGGVGEAERKIRHRLHHRLLRPQRGHRRLQQHLMSFRLQTNQIINKGQNNHRREYCQATTQLSGTPSHYKIQMGWEHQATTKLKWVGTPSHYKIQMGWEHQATTKTGMGWNTKPLQNSNGSEHQATTKTVMGWNTKPQQI